MYCYDSLLTKWASDLARMAPSARRDMAIEWGSLLFNHGRDVRDRPVSLSMLLSGSAALSFCRQLFYACFRVHFGSGHSHFSSVYLHFNVLIFVAAVFGLLSGGMVFFRETRGSFMSQGSFEVSFVPLRLEYIPFGVSGLISQSIFSGFPPITSS